MTENGSLLETWWLQPSTTTTTVAEVSGAGETLSTRMNHLVLILAVSLAALVLVVAGFVAIVLILQWWSVSRARRFAGSDSFGEDGRQSVSLTDVWGDELQNNLLRELIAAATRGVQNTHQIDEFILSNLCHLDQRVVSQMTAEERATWLRLQRRSLFREYQQRALLAQGLPTPHTLRRQGSSTPWDSHTLQREEEVTPSPQDYPIAQRYEASPMLPNVVDASVVVPTRHVDAVFMARKGRGGGSATPVIAEKQSSKRHLLHSIAELSASQASHFMYEPRREPRPGDTNGLRAPSGEDEADTAGAGECRVFRSIKMNPEASDCDGYRLFRRLSPVRIYGTGCEYLPRPPQATTTEAAAGSSDHAGISLNAIPVPAGMREPPSLPNVSRFAPHCSQYAHPSISSLVEASYSLTSYYDDGDASASVVGEIEFPTPSSAASSPPPPPSPNDDEAAAQP